MATASAMGRPLASRPPDHQEEPWMRGECIRLPHSNRMTTSMTYWNHQANLSHQHHHYRRASTVQITMEQMSIEEWTDLRTGVWTSPEPPDPAGPQEAWYTALLALGGSSVLLTD
ncbi:uncharacterized protein AB9X84_012299 [Acanthopagrus schlegelii]